MSKKILCIALIVVLALSVIGCDAGTPVKTSAPAATTAPAVKTSAPTSATTAPSTPAYQLAEGKTVKIGWSCHFWNPFNTGMDAYIKDTVKKLSGGKAEIITVGAEGDAVKQVADIEDLMAQDVDVIMIKAQDLTTTANVLGEAREKGIKVILLQRRMQTENYDFYVGSNFKTVGTEAAQEVLKKFPNGNFNYCFLEGSATGANDLDIMNGAEKVFADSKLPGIVKLDGQNSQILRAESKKITEDWITAYGDKIDVILTTADELRIGAEQALAESSLKKVVYTTGCNAVTECIDSVKSGQCLYTAAISPGVFPGLELIMEIANGNMSKYTHRDIEIPVTGVTPANVMQFYDKVKAANLYMVGLLPPAQNPLFTKLKDQGFPELVPLLHD
ncbi:MAG: sugar ABC transporter substrate-binding protein [Christensenellales bacterium]